VARPREDGRHSTQYLPPFGEGRAWSLAMKILIVKMSAIGDVIHTLPALTALRRHYPDAQIDWLVEDTAADLLEGHPALSCVLVWRRKRFRELLMAGRFFSAAGLFLSSLRALRRTRYDLIIDFQALLKSSLWIFFSHGRRKAGFGKGMEHAEHSHLFLNERIPAPSMEIHALDRGLKLIEALGVDGSRVVYDLLTEERNAQALLEEKGIHGHERLIAINPVAKWPTKLWEPRKFAELNERLLSEGYQVVFTGSREDGAMIDEIGHSNKLPLIRLDGQTTLKTLAAVYRLCGAVVTTDTGPMHLAAAVGTPVVALFGPTAPWRTGPYGEGHVVVRAGLNCSPCFMRTCHTHEFEKMACMKGITVGAVVEGVHRVAGKGAFFQSTGATGGV
jgi:heptosyltransferase-1